MVKLSVSAEWLLLNCAKFVSTEWFLWINAKLQEEANRTEEEWGRDCGLSGVPGTNGRESSEGSGDGVLAELGAWYALGLITTRSFVLGRIAAMGDAKKTGGDASEPVPASADPTSTVDIAQSMDVDPADNVSSDLGPTSQVPDTSHSEEDPSIFVAGRTFVVSNDTPTTDAQDALDEEVSDWATAKIYDRILKSVNWTVKGIHKMNKYEVKDNRRGDIVDLTKGTCSCRKWQLSGLPCGHVCAVARVTGLTSVEGLVKDWFLRTTLKNTYTGMFNPAQDVATWETRDDLQVVLAPVIIKRQAGRPKNKDRIRSQGEEPVKKQCTRCGANGHNRGSCNVPLVTKKRCATRKMRSLRALCHVPRIANGKPRSLTRNENLNNAAHPESTNQQSMNVPTPPASIGMINRLSQMSTPQNFLV
ncbi:hypothetical protein CTI12_AA313100 [Artemisia annua]|uniref:SWIM-type domain-containing protein n=1 Tax=Artemisia annua TaxID=35608 RepID=A0A2U1N3Z3_ARTAN|nr:hypothetical protein CTI12_AA313100 [Artemisia annua]